MTYSRRPKTRYGNEPSQFNGRSFASKLEASVYKILLSREQAGEIQVVQLQDHVYLTRARIGYIPDFKCIDLKSGLFFWVEAKGFPNDRWPMKKKLWKFYGPGQLEIYMGHWQYPKLVETVIPQRGSDDD